MTKKKKFYGSIDCSRSLCSNQNRKLKKSFSVSVSELFWKKSQRFLIFQKASREMLFSMNLKTFKKKQCIEHTEPLEFDSAIKRGVSANILNFHYILSNF